jgi:DNA-binding NarL/FixJ family response regulator
MSEPLPRILLAEESLPYRRVIREAATAFFHCEIDDAPSAEAAFDLALRQPYALYVFSHALPDMSGEMLDRLLSKAIPLTQGSASAPPVVFLVRAEDADRWQHMLRDARVRGHAVMPPRLDKLLPLLGKLLQPRVDLAPPHPPAPVAASTHI